MVTVDRITRLRIRGMRTLEDVTLELDGLIVLIGENGSGKSSIIEAVELLRRATTTGFDNDLYGIHGGPGRLLRTGGTEITLEARIADELDYHLTLTRVDQSLEITDERLTDARGIVFDYRLDRAAADHGAPTPPPPPLVRHRSKGEDVRTSRVRAALEQMQVHASFEVLASWVAVGSQRRSAMRESQLIRPATMLERLGVNIASAYSALKNDFGRVHWDETLELVRLGLGNGVESVDVAVDPAGGAAAIRLRMKGRETPIAAPALSDGTLAYLAIVALVRLGERSSLIALDEPDLHLHPGLVVRVAQLLERLGGSTSVVVATHSDRFLDALRDPARAVRVLELDDHGATVVRRLDSGALATWLSEYSGVGSLRADGNLLSVIADDAGSPDHPL